jgi:hypothetical protein
MEMQRSKTYTGGIMDLFSIVASVVVAAVGGALSWLLKKAADKSDSTAIDILMRQLDEILWSNILPPLKARIRAEIQGCLPQDIEDKYVDYVLSKLDTMAPKVLSKLGFSQEGLEEYVRGTVRNLIEDLIEIEDAKAQEM